MFDNSMKVHPLNVPLSYGWCVTVLLALKKIKDFKFPTCDKLSLSLIPKHLS